MIKLWVLLITLSSCSESLNINGLFVTSMQRERLEYLLEQAQLKYDEGKFSEAKALIDKAKVNAPNNEDVAILSGYIELGLAGLSTFDLAKAMISAGKNTTSLTLAENGAGVLLSTIATAMNISDSDMRLLGEIDSGDTQELFDGIELIIPVLTTEARDGRILALQSLNNAIMSVCRFVDPTVKLEEDSRHMSAECEETGKTAEKGVLASFLWAFAHLGEASVYYSVVQYTESEQESTNLQRRSDILAAEKDSLTLSQYASHAVDLADDLTSVINTADQDSMFNGLINGIRATSLAFGTMGSGAESIKASVDKAMDAINEKKDQVEGDTEQGQQAAAFKAKLNAGIASAIAEKIQSAAADDAAAFAENKTELCAAYTDVGGLETLEECQ